RALIMLGLNQGMNVGRTHGPQFAHGVIRALGQGLHGLEQRIHADLMDLEEQIRFRGEVVIHHAFGGAQATGDVINAGGVEATIHEAARGGIQDGIARARGEVDVRHGSGYSLLGLWKGLILPQPVRTDILLAKTDIMTYSFQSLHWPKVYAHLALKPLNTPSRL